MDHLEYVRGLNEGSLEIDVNRVKALRTIDSVMVPMICRFGYRFINLLCKVSIPVALSVMLFHHWLAGLLVLVVVTPGISIAAKMFAERIMIVNSVDSPEFYDYAVSQKVIHARKKTLLARISESR